VLWLSPILSKANLFLAHLERVDLTNANLILANLDGTTLDESDLSRAVVSSTVFAEVDLSNVRGLETVYHEGPSTIGIDTVVLSKGKIPDTFLRGCGVPDSFIDYLPSLLGAMQPIQFYSCFISYSTKDEEFAKRLHSKMRDNNLSVWFANEDLKGGHKLHEQSDSLDGL
jgi:uncharacterized protein YjbI with pentapeptide repeats